MNAIRCPDCGQENYREDATYPYCSKCQEDLARCTACRHHEGTGCRHPRAFTRFTPDNQAAKDCPAFVSRHEVRGSRWLTQLAAPLWVSVLILLILGSLAAASWFIDPAARYFRGNPLRVETAVEQQAIAGHPFQVRMLITNVMDRPSTRLYVEIGSEFLAHADWIVPTPQPKRLELDRQRLLLEYESLPRNGQLQLLLTFIPRQEGTLNFIARVFAPSNQMRRVIAVPVQVNGSL